MAINNDQNQAPGRSGTLKSEKIDGFENIETGTPRIYELIYDRIFWDLNCAEVELTGPAINYANLIHTAAHLRLIIEEVTTASFAASHVLFAKAQEQVETAKNFGEIRKRVKNLNPNYWPTALGEDIHNGERVFRVFPEVGVQESDVGQHFGFVSTLLHAPNPFKREQVSPGETLDKLRALVQSFQELLPCHIVQLAGSSEFLYLRRTEEGELRTQAIKTDRPLL